MDDGLERIDPNAMLAKIAGLERAVFGEGIYELQPASEGVCPDCERDRLGTGTVERWIIGDRAYCWDHARARRRVARRGNA